MYIQNEWIIRGLKCYCYCFYLHWKGFESFPVLPFQKYYIFLDLVFRGVNSVAPVKQTSMNANVSSNWFTFKHRRSRLWKKKSHCSPAKEVTYCLRHNRQCQTAHNLSCHQYPIITYNSGNTRTRNVYVSHWGLMADICASKLGHHWSGNGLSSIGRQAITCTNDDFLSSGYVWTNFSEIQIIKKNISGEYISKCDVYKVGYFVQALMWYIPVFIWFYTAIG